jgi:hypothetical protein
MKMKRLLILAVSAFLLVSCGAEVIPSGDYEGDLAENARVSGPWPHFESEEEFVDFILEAQSGTMDEGDAFQYRDLDLNAYTHYYRLKNPPPGAVINFITITASPLSVDYDIDRIDGYGLRERIVIIYSPHSSYNIEDEGLWVRSRHSGESRIFEEDGLKYYIWQGISISERPLWSAEWVNADGYNMNAEFPYRFTAEEVLGYISDLERVEIG